jgi:hypothetical protein
MRLGARETRLKVKKAFPLRAHDFRMFGLGIAAVLKVRRLYCSDRKG